MGDASAQENHMAPSALIFAGVRPNTLESYIILDNSPAEPKQAEAGEIEMSKIVKLAAAFSLFATVPAYAADRTPEQVVKDHVVSMKTADVDKVMSDYADDTVVITPPGLVPGQTPANAPGVYSGKANARKVFVVLTGKGSIDGIRAMETVVEPLGGDVALLRWMQFRGTPKQVSGVDVFVVRNDKIVVQDIVLDTAKP